MKEWLARDCPESVVDDQINKAVLGKNHLGKKNSENAIPFAVACHPKLKGIWKLIKDYSRFFTVTKKLGQFFHLLHWFYKVVPEK